MAKRKKPTHVDLETFQPIAQYEIRTQNEPSCFNGEVRFRRYRITCEPLEESFEVLSARLQKLWDYSDNPHHHMPLTAAARELGYELQGDRGSKREDKP